MKRGIVVLLFVILFISGCSELGPRSKEEIHIVDDKTYDQALDTFMKLVELSKSERYKESQEDEINVVDRLSNCWNNCPNYNGRIDCLVDCSNTHCPNQCWDPACDC